MNKELSLEEIQQESFKVLCKIKEIFDENGWKYYLSFGTLIGAVRHKGFIPWDDDIDILVPRSDYEKFIKYCKENEKDLGKYKLFHYSTCKNYPYVLARFSNTEFSLDYKGFKDYGLGVFVDIYPLDIVNDDLRRKKINRMIRHATLVSHISDSYIKRIVKFFIRPFILLLDGVLSKKSLLRKIDNVSQEYNNKSDAEYWACVAWCRNYIKYNINSFSPCKELYFESELFSVPSDYDSVLRLDYGDYMKVPPKEERIPHHYYKVYKK